jgi:hypothetical protein
LGGVCKEDEGGFMKEVETLMEEALRSSRGEIESDSDEDEG